MTKARANLSENFTAAEFDCRNGVQWPPAARDALELWCAVWGEPLRREFGPVRVTSGFRTPDYNHGVGGAGQSYHVYTLRYGPRALPGLGKGLAADVVPARGTPAAWQRWASGHQMLLRARRGGLRGVSLSGRLAAVAYPRSGFIHLDTGPARTWVG